MPAPSGAAMASRQVARYARNVPIDLTQHGGGDLSVTLAPLAEDGSGDGIKSAFDRIAMLGLRSVQIAATVPGLRPRDLDRAARRDLSASLRRRELAVSGLDAWVPSGHFGDAAHSDRAVQAMCEIIDLAGDLGRVPVSTILPAEAMMARELVDHAQRAGVEVADHAVPLSGFDGAGIGIDPAAWLSQAKDPIAAVHAAGARLISARLVDLPTSGLRGPIGSSHDARLDVAGYKVALSVNGYRRPVIIDARQWGEPWRGIDQCIAAWRRV